MLSKEALYAFANVIKIGEKINDYDKLAEAYSMAAWLDPVFENALLKSLQALKYCEKTDSNRTKGMVYANLVRQYTQTGDLSHAIHYLNKLEKLPLEILSQGWVMYPLTKSIVLAGEGKWKESMDYFQQFLKSSEIHPRHGVQAYALANYAWILEVQGLPEQATKQSEKVQRLVEDSQGILNDFKVSVSLMAPSKVRTAQAFEIRLDIVNISRKIVRVVAIDDLIPLKSTAKVLTQHNFIEKNSVRMDKKEIGSFEDLPIKLSLTINEPGIYLLDPQVSLLNEKGEKKKCKSNRIEITVQSTIDQTGLEAISKSTETTFSPFNSINTNAQMTNNPTIVFVFREDTANKAFNFLVSAFIEDYMQRKLVAEKAGWRSLMEIIKNAKLPKSSMYGFENRKGRALVELEKRGFVDLRFFPGERGRGGKILRLRVCYDREAIKNHIVREITKKNK